MTILPIREPRAAVASAGFRSAAPRSRGVVLAAAALLALVLGGCSALTRPAPVRQTFLLEPAPPTPSAQARPGALRMGSVRVAAPYRGKAFVYRMGDLRFQTDYYVEFLVSPEAMLTDQTARALDHARVFERVARPGSGADADWRLDGFAPALYADVRDPAKAYAEIAVTYYLSRGGGVAQTPVWTREYHRRVAMRDASPGAYAEALNVGFGEIVAQLARDLAGAALPAH